MILQCRNRTTAISHCLFRSSATCRKEKRAALFDCSTQRSKSMRIDAVTAATAVRLPSARTQQAQVSRDHVLPVLPKRVWFRRASSVQGFPGAIKLRQRRSLHLIAAEHNIKNISRKSLGKAANVAGSSDVASTEDITLQKGKTPPLTRTSTVTIHGIELDEDIKRLNVELKNVNGIVDFWIGPLVQGGPRGGYATVQLEVQNEVPLAVVTREIQALDDTKLLVLPFTSHSWTWRDYKINFGVAGCGRPIILVHGFGGNAGHFGSLISYLADHYRVYAIDLLGFGASQKPTDIDYSPDLWAELVSDFTQEVVGEGAVLVGNSIGSLTALTAAAKSDRNLIRGLVLLNCAGAMNRKGLTQDGWLLQLLTPVFVAVENLLRRPAIANFLFNKFRTKDNIRKILVEQAYRNKEAVTGQLVDILHHPSADDGAVDVFVKVFTGDNPGSRPEKLMLEVDIPVLVLWGDSDAWTPVNGPVAKFFMQLAKERDNVKVYALKDVGHCPHDDRPQLAAEYILSFLTSIDW